MTPPRCSARHQIKGATSSGEEAPSGRASGGVQITPTTADVKGATFAFEKDRLAAASVTRTSADSAPKLSS